MVSNRCKMAVKEELKKLGLHFMLIDLGEVDVMENLLNKQREFAFKKYFIENGTVSQLIIHPTELGIPFNGLSEYSIRYSGLSPESLKSARLKMKIFNDKVPRLLYKKDRKILSRRP